MKAPWIFVLALAAAAGGAAQPAPQIPSKATPRASRPLSADETQTSPSLTATEAALRSDLAEHPDSPAILYSLALILRQENKPRESLELYTRAAALHKPDAHQLRSVALDYVLLNDYDDALRWLRVAQAMEPRNVDVLYSLGRVLYTQNLFPEAERAYLGVLELNPHHLKAEENLGLTYDAQNQPAKAEEALRTAARWADEQKAADPWPYLDLGVFLLDQGRPTDAVSPLAKAAALAPSLADAREKYGRALATTGQYAEAIRELERAVELDPKSPKAHFELGRAYRDSGDAGRAHTEFDISKELYGQRSHD